MKRIPHFTLRGGGAGHDDTRKYGGLYTLSPGMSDAHHAGRFLTTQDAYCGAQQLVRLAWETIVLQPPNADTLNDLVCAVALSGWALQATLLRTRQLPIWDLFYNKLWQANFVDRKLFVVDTRMRISGIRRTLFTDLTPEDMKDQEFQLLRASDRIEALACGCDSLSWDPKSTHKKYTEYTTVLVKSLQRGLDRITQKEGKEGYKLKIGSIPAGIDLILAATHAGIRHRDYISLAFGPGRKTQFRVLKDALIDKLSSCSEKNCTLRHYECALALLSIDSATDLNAPDADDDDDVQIVDANTGRLRPVGGAEFKKRDKIRILMRRVAGVGMSLMGRAQKANDAQSRLDDVRGLLLVSSSNGAAAASPEPQADIRLVSVAAALLSLVAFLNLDAPSADSKKEVHMKDNRGTQMQDLIPIDDGDREIFQEQNLDLIDFTSPEVKFDQSSLDEDVACGLKELNIGDDGSSHNAAPMDTGSDRKKSKPVPESKRKSKKPEPAPEEEPELELEQELEPGPEPGPEPEEETGRDAGPEQEDDMFREAEEEEAQAQAQALEQAEEELASIALPLEAGEGESKRGIKRKGDKEANSDNTKRRRLNLKWEVPLTSAMVVHFIMLPKAASPQPHEYPESPEINADYGKPDPPPLVLFLSDQELEEQKAGGHGQQEEMQDDLDAAIALSNAAAQQEAEEEKKQDMDDDKSAAAIVDEFVGPAAGAVDEAEGGGDEGDEGEGEGEGDEGDEGDEEDRLKAQGWHDGPVAPKKPAPAVVPRKPAPAEEEEEEEEEEKEEKVEEEKVDQPEDGGEGDEGDEQPMDTGNEQKMEDNDDLEATAAVAAKPRPKPRRLPFDDDDDGEQQEQPEPEPELKQEQEQEQEQRGSGKGEKGSGKEEKDSVNLFKTDNEMDDTDEFVNKRVSKNEEIYNEEVDSKKMLDVVLPAPLSVTLSSEKLTYLQKDDSDLHIIPFDSFVDFALEVAVDDRYHRIFEIRRVLPEDWKATPVVADVPDGWVAKNQSTAYLRAQVAMGCLIHKLLLRYKRTLPATATEVNEVNFLRWLGTLPAGTNFLTDTEIDNPTVYCTETSSKISKISGSSVPLHLEQAIHINGEAKMTCLHGSHGLLGLMLLFASGMHGYDQTKFTPLTFYDASRIGGEQIKPGPNRKIFFSRLYKNKKDGYETGPYRQPAP